MATQRRSTKKALRVLIFVGVFLILALIGAIVYFYMIGDITPGEEEREQITCGCYMIDPAVVNDCGDPKKAMFFTTKTVSADQTCSAACNTDLLSEYVIKSSTTTDRYKSCTVRSISDSRCQNMILTDQDGKLITGKINPEDEVNVEAEFDSDSYTNYSFRVNTQNIEPDRTDGKKIYTKISEFDSADSLDILATATDNRGNSINSIICRRVVEIEKEGGIGANSLIAATERQSDGSTRISQVIITVGQLTSENVKVNFSFGSQYPTIVAQDGLNIESAKGTITITKANLYDISNFAGDQSFSVLNTHKGELTITAEVFADTMSIGVVSTKVTFAETEEPILEEPEDPTQEERSSFTASKSVTPMCVERVAGNNTATFTLSVKNNAESAEDITSVKDKLPLGFRYIEGSTTINGTSIPDSGTVSVTTVGSTQEIVWQQTNPWNVAADGQITILFRATADSSALTGENLNEIIVNPVVIPTDPATLRAETVIVVAQDCDNIPQDQQPGGPSTPSTGILDNIYVRILIGVILFFTAWAVYTRPEGTKLSKMILDSEIYKGAEMTRYKLTNPKKYFEQKIIREKK